MQDQYQTGSEIAKLMAKWMDKNNEQIIWDPACGEANILSKLEEKLPDADLHGIELKERKQKKRGIN